MQPKISENIEEYLEVLYKFGNKSDFVSTTTLSKELSIAPGSVTQMLKKLEDLGYIQYTPYKGALLTDKGMKVSQKITRKHRILERFLKDVLKILMGEEIANNDIIRKDVSLQKLIPITVGGTVVSDEDSTPIKNILVSSNIDKTITDEKGYYELRTCALENEKAKIYFDDDDMYSNGGYFSSDTLEIPLEKDKTFDNNISLKKFVED